MTLVVTEDGVGRESPWQGRAFDPRFSHGEMRRGVGAGLSTVYAIVKRNGGHLRLTSAPGEGARFELFFPMASESAGSPAG